MDEIDICLECGNQCTEFVVFNGIHHFICWHCDERDHEPCLCEHDCMNPNCPSCF